MRLDQFDFELPADRIAAHPVNPRDSARLLVLDGLLDRRVRDLPELLEPGEGERAPATTLATRVIERARSTGVLLSTDGPHRNVIKVKPPLSITETEADLLVTVLDRALSEAGG